MKWFAKDYLTAVWKNQDSHGISLALQTTLSTYKPHYISSFNPLWASRLSFVLLYLTQVHLSTTMQETFLLF